MEKEPKTLERQIAHLDELFADADSVEHMSARDVMAELKREGLDTAKSIAALREKLAVLHRRQAIQAAGANRKSLLQSMGSGIGKAVAATRTEIDSLLADLKASNPGAAQVYACKLKKASDADLASLKQDIEAARKMRHGPKRRN